MRRRALLTSLAASTSALAGCSLLSDGDRPQDTFDVSDPPTETTTTKSVDPPPDDVRKAFTVPGADDRRVAVTIPTGIPDDVSVTLGFTNESSPDAPATLYVRVGVRDTADGPVKLPVGATPPLSAYRGVHSPERDGENTRPMLLVPQRAGAAFKDIVRRDQGCWRPKLPVGPQDDVEATRTLDPGEALAREYYLVTPWATDRCLRPGAYRFSAAAGWRFHVCPFDREPPGESANADASVPGLPGFPETRWYHEADPSLYVRPRAEQVGLPSATATFEFRNQTDSTVRVDESEWSLYKLEGDRWHPIAPLAGPANQNTDDPIYPGRTSTLALTLTTNPDAVSDDDRRAVGGLGQGQYAVAYPATLELPGPDNDGVRPTAALLTVVGNPPPVDTTDAIDHVTDRGGVRHVYTTPDESAVATLHVERTSAGDDERVTPLVTEQVLQRDALRNALVELQDAPDPIDTVRYHTAATAIERITAWIDRRGDGLTFTYEDATYSMRYK
jgi:hypothetical protein